MDDVLVLAPTRWRLRKAVQLVNQVLGGLGLDKHPDKTFIGRIERGFDFLSYRFSPSGLTVAASTMERFVARATRLYEQERRGRGRGIHPVLTLCPLGSYVERWQRWVGGGLTTPRVVPQERVVLTRNDADAEVAALRDCSSFRAPVSLPPATPLPTLRKNERVTIRVARELRAANCSLRAIGRRLTDVGLLPRCGGRWHAKTVNDLLRSVACIAADGSAGAGEGEQHEASRIRSDGPWTQRSADAA